MSILDFIYLFLDRGREGEREEEKHQCVVAFCSPPTGDLACNPGMYPDWELNQHPFGSQAGAQSTEPHWPGLLYIYIFFLFLPFSPSLEDMAIAFREMRKEGGGERGG